MPAFTTACHEMISRSWASMMKAPRTTSPFRQVNSKPSLHRHRFDRMTMTLPSWTCSGRSEYFRANSRLWAFMIR